MRFSLVLWSCFVLLTYSGYFQLAGMAKWTIQGTYGIAQSPWCLARRSFGISTCIWRRFSGTRRARDRCSSAGWTGCQSRKRGTRTSTSRCAIRSPNGRAPSTSAVRIVALREFVLFLELMLSELTGCRFLCSCSRTGASGGEELDKVRALRAETWPRRQCALHLRARDRVLRRREPRPSARRGLRAIRGVAAWGFH